MAHSEGQARQTPLEEYWAARHGEQVATPISVGVDASQAQLAGAAAARVRVGGQVRQS